MNRSSRPHQTWNRSNIQRNLQDRRFGFGFVKNTYVGEMAMDIATLAKYVVPSFLLFVSAQVSAATITFDFLNLVENHESEVVGKLGNGENFSGFPEEGSYQTFTWSKQGLSVTASAEHWFEDDFGNVTDIVPMPVYLQKNFAGLGKCLQPAMDNRCGAIATDIDYTDRIFLGFSEVVEITNISFSIGRDDSDIGPDDDDYRAYNMRLNTTGSPMGPMSDLMGQGDTWSGSLFGNQIAFFRPEGTGSYIESITVNTTDVPEPASLGLLMFGLASLGLRGAKNRFRF